MSYIVDKIIEVLNVECEVLENYNNDLVLEKYKEELEKSKNSDYTPVLIIPSDLILEAIEENSEETYEDFLEKAKKDFDTINLKDSFKKFLDNIADKEHFEFHDFKEKEERKHFYVSKDDENEFEIFEEIILAKIPTKKPWELALWFPIAVVNYDISELEQAKVFEYYYKKYSAMPAMVSYNEWELYLENPIRDKKTAIQISKELYLFCPDLVWEINDSIENLAKSIYNSNFWYLYWD